MGITRYVLLGSYDICLDLFHGFRRLLCPAIRLPHDSVDMDSNGSGSCPYIHLMLYRPDVFVRHIEAFLLDSTVEVIEL